MKRKLLLAALFVVSALGFNAKAQEGGTYYIQNVGAGRFIEGGNDWGTKATITDRGIEFTLAVGEGTYTIKSGLGGGFLGKDGFVDQASADWKITPVDEGTYTLAVDGKYLVWSGAGTALDLIEQAPTSANGYYKFITKEERIAALANATKDNPISATFLIGDPNFSRYEASSPWTMNAGNKNLSGGNQDNQCAESYHSTFSLTQTISAPKGVYSLTAQGFYRQDGSDNDNLPYFFIGDEKMTFPVKTGTENSMGNASTSFSNGLYLTSPIYVAVGDEGTVELGAKNDVNTSLWCIWDNFQIMYYGSESTIAEIKAGAVYTDYNNVSGKAMNAEISAAMEDAKSAYEADPSDDNLAAFITTVSDATFSVEVYANSKVAIDNMYDLMASTNVYTKEAYDTYKAAADAYFGKWDAGTLTETVVNPYAVQDWGAAHANPNPNMHDDFLLSAWGTKDFDTNLYINTWSVEGEGDGSNFKVPFFEYWTGDANSLATTTKTATVVGLESEQLYTVSAWVRVRAKNGQTDPHGITLSVGDGTPTDVTKGSRIGDTQFYIAEVTAVGKTNAEGTLTINFNVAEDNNISWLSYKNVKYNSGTDTDLLLVAYNSALAAANEAAAKDMLPSVKEILETVIAENSNVDNTDPDALTAATAALNEAVKNATPSIKSYEVLANGVPNNSLDGWTCTNTNAFQVNTWSIEADNTGMVTPFIENWVGKETILGEGQFYYTMKDIAPGSYCVSALIRVYSESGSEPSGAAFFVGDQTVDITTGESFEYNGMKGVYDNYSAIATVGEDGVLKFGVDIKAERTFNWVAIKNVVVKEYHTTSNLDFSESTPIDNHICTYAKDMATNGTTYSQMQPVTSWDMAVENGDARAAGVFAYGGTPWIGGAGYPAPATNPEGVAEGNALGLIAVWSATVQYTQPVTLLPGNYVLTVPVYNTGAGKNNMAKNLIGFIAEDGTEYLASAKVYPSNTWTPETITFTLDKVTNGVLSLGYQAPNAGNGDQHHLFIDCVKIKVVSELDLAKEELLADIEDAKATVDAKANVGDGLFMIPTADYDTYAAAVVAAQNVYDNATTVADVEAAIATLAAAGETYAGSIALPEADKDYQIIHNASGLFMSLNGGVKIEAAATVKFEAAGDGKYYIANANGEYAYYSGTGDNKWSLNVSAGSKEAWTITAVGDGLYTIKGKNGHIGTDNLTNGSTCYGNKAGDAANSMWLIREAKEVFVEMKISDAKYSTFIAPFEVTIPEGVKASKVTGATDGVLTLEDLEGTIPANTPVVLYSETEYKNQFTGIDLSTKDSYTDDFLTGVYTATDVQLGWYVLQNNGGKVGFYRVDTEAITKVGANRCYLTIPAESEAKAFFFGGEATGISAIEALQNGDAEIYTINGTRVNTLQKGINIVKMSNGKTQKVLVK